MNLSCFPIEILVVERRGCFFLLSHLLTQFQGTLQKLYRILKHPSTLYLFLNARPL